MNEKFEIRSVEMVRRIRDEFADGAPLLRQGVMP
jgi:hypothetical protein